MLKQNRSIKSLIPYQATTPEILIIQKLILKHDIKNKDSTLNTLLHRLFMIFDQNQPQSQQIAKKLIHLGLDPNIRNKEGWTALSLGVRSKQLQAIEFALNYNKDNHKAKFNIQKTIGDNHLNILHIACVKGYRCVILLLQDVDAFTVTKGNIRPRYMTQADILVWKLLNKIEMYQLQQLNNGMDFGSFGFQLTLQSENMEDGDNIHHDWDEQVKIDYKFQFNVKKHSIQGNNWQKILLRTQQFLDLISIQLSKDQLNITNYLVYFLLLKLCELQKIIIDQKRLIDLLQIIDIGSLQIYNILYLIKRTQDYEISEKIDNLKELLKNKYCHQPTNIHSQIDLFDPKTRSRSHSSDNHFNRHKDHKTNQNSQNILNQYELLQNSNSFY